MSDDHAPPGSQPPPSASPVPTSGANRRWWIVGGGVVLVAVVVVVIVVLTTGGGSSSVAAGPAVEALQKDLTTLGYYKGPINGDYDTATQDAVKQLQSASGLPADGRLTPQTIAALDKALGGQESQTIKAFQKTLSDLGWYTGPIDGSYGPVTAQAVAGLQAQMGVTADGILGPETFTAFANQCQPNPAPCKKPAKPATTIAATTTQAQTSPAPTTAAQATTTNHPTTTNTNASTTTG